MKRREKEKLHRARCTSTRSRAAGLSVRVLFCCILHESERELEENGRRRFEVCVARRQLRACICDSRDGTSFSPFLFLVSFSILEGKRASRTEGQHSATFFFPFPSSLRCFFLLFRFPFSPSSWKWSKLPDWVPHDLPPHPWLLGSWSLGGCSPMQSCAIGNRTDPQNSCVGSCMCAQFLPFFAALPAQVIATGANGVWVREGVSQNLVLAGIAFSWFVFLSFFYRFLNQSNPKHVLVEWIANKKTTTTTTATKKKKVITQDRLDLRI